MPHFTLTVEPAGPILFAYFTVSQQRGQALQAGNEPVPSAFPARALVDTGASCTCVDPVIVASLGLSPRGIVSIHTPSGANAVDREQYDAGLVIPATAGSTPHILGTIAVVQTELAHQGFEALIGRDILRDCVFIYNGNTMHFTLAF